MKYLKKLTALALAVCLISGCSAPAADPPSASSSSAAPSYESYSREQLQAREEFDRLTEELFLDEVTSSLTSLHYTLADPEAYGITDYPRTLGTYSPEDIEEDLAEVKELQKELSAIDSRLLSDEQLLTWQILSSVVSSTLSAEGLELYDQPLSSSLGIQSQLPILLSEYAFYDKQDVEDYLSLLSSIDECFQSLIEYETEQTAAGLGLSDPVIDRVIQSCEAYLLDADHSFITETFRSRLEETEGLTEQEKAAYLEQNRQIMNEQFVPAYRHLIDGLTGLKGSGGNEMGLYYLPEGRRYYQYLVNSKIGTSYRDIPSLKKAISEQIVADLTVTEQLLTEHPSISEEVSSYSFSLTDPDQILEDLRKQCSRDFPEVAGYSCQIKSVPEALEPVLSPAFYLTVPLDRPLDHSIYINRRATDSRQSLYTTMAHEGYPGHMYQNMYFNQTDVCNLRKVLNFISYSEGWATYSELYSYELDNGLSPELAQFLKHNSAFTLALYALLDINIHYEGWDQQQLLEYLELYFRISDPEVISSIYYDIVENPANYLVYYAGYLEILNMEKEARKILGERFSRMEFNRFLLDIGPAPFNIIRPYFQKWVAEGK